MQVCVSSRPPAGGGAGVRGVRATAAAESEEGGIAQLEAPVLADMRPPYVEQLRWNPVAICSVVIAQFFAAWSEPECCEMWLRKKERVKEKGGCTCCMRTSTPSTSSFKVCPVVM